MIMDVKQAQIEYFNKSVSKELLYKAIRLGQIPHVKVQGKILLDSESLDRWFKNQLIQSVQQGISDVTPARSNVQGKLRKIPE